MSRSTKRTSPTLIAPMTRRYLRELHVAKAQARAETQIAAAAVVAVADVDPGAEVAEVRAAAANACFLWI